MPRVPPHGPPTPLDGSVTIEQTETPHVVLIKATWTRNGEARSASATVGGTVGHALARHWTDQLAAGQEPLV